jgi:Fe-S cluster assembly protein SufD
MGALLDSLLTGQPVRAEPAWLRDARAEAAQALRSEGLPSPRDEAWKYTALRALDARRFRFADESAAGAVDMAALALPDDGTPRLVFADGVFRADLSCVDALPPGLQLRTLAQVLAEQPDALRFRLSRRYAGGSEVFARLNTALARDGMLLRVEAGAAVSKPVHLVHLGQPAQGDVAWALRHMVELGQGASLCLVEHYLGDADAHLGNVVAHYDLHAGARLRLVQRQEAAAGASLMRRSEFDLGAGASLAATTLELGGSLVRHDLQARLRGEGARLVSRGTFALRGRQHADTQLEVRHEARDTSCDLLWRGLADQRARGVFRGAITIAAGADGSAAALSNKNLLLSAQAEIDTQPMLEIHADEVQASHGATVGQLDSQALFYLRSRGVPAAQARTMLVAAFCREVLDQVEDDGLREFLDGRLQARLPAAGDDA